MLIRNEFALYLHFIRKYHYLASLDRYIFDKSVKIFYLLYYAALTAPPHTHTFTNVYVYLSMLKEDDTHDLRKHYKWETVMTTAGMTAPPKVTDDKNKGVNLWFGLWILKTER